MLLKLLKYDIKAIWKIALLVSIASVGAGLIGGAGFRVFYEGATGTAESPFYIVGFFAFLMSFFAIAAANAVISIFVFMRFYKNLFTDEGYLTFTLPVSRRTVLLSKTLNSLIWFVVSLVVAALSMAMYIPFMPLDSSEFVMGVKDMLSLFGYVSESMNIWNYIQLVLAALSVIVGSVFGICLIQLCISLGAMLVKKGKLLIGILFYFIINSVIQFAAQIGGIIVSLLYEGLFGYGSAGYGTVGADIFLTVVVFVVFILTAVLMFLSYFFTQRIIDRKLNLA